jgi:hypothetical protein
MKSQYIITAATLIVVTVISSLALITTIDPIQEAQAARKIQIQNSGGLGCHDYDLGMSYPGCCKGNSLCGG